MVQEMLGFNVQYSEGPGTVEGAFQGSLLRGWVDGLWESSKTGEVGRCGKRTLEKVVMRKNAQ